MNCPCAVGRGFGAPVSDPARFSTAPNASLSKRPTIATQFSISQSVWSVVASAPLLGHGSTRQSSLIKENQTRSLIKRRYLSKTNLPESNKTKDNDNKIKQH
jgi:hypothetical protein